MIINEQQGSYVIQANNTIEFIAQDKPKATFRRLWIYPGVPQSDGTLSTNSAAVKIGKAGDGPKVVPDLLNPTDAPIKIDLPVGEGGIQDGMKLDALIIRGTAGDGVFFSYWT